MEYSSGDYNHQGEALPPTYNHQGEALPPTYNHTPTEPDLFILVYPLATYIMATGFAGEFMIGSSDQIRCEACHLVFALITPLYSSFFTIALMSLDRFLYIYKPFQYEHANTKYIAIVAVLVAVLVSIALGLVAQLAPGR